MTPLPSIQAVKRVVAAETGLNMADFSSPRRARSLAWPRMVAMALAEKHCRFASLPLIGYHFGGRDHTTVLHAIRRVATLRCVDPGVKSLWEICDKRITHESTNRNAALALPIAGG